MKVLVACEYSGIVRDAFIAQGHDAISCDILPTDAPGPHYQGNVLPLLNEEWDLIIAHPPCTYLTVSAARWLVDQPQPKSGALVGAARRQAQAEAADFFMKFVNAKAKRIAIENPIGAMSSLYRKPDQILQPWQFGHGETKAICLWLKGLQPLVSTKIVAERENRIHRMPPSKERGKLRSRFYEGIADAMAKQWGGWK